MTNEVSRYNQNFTDKGRALGELGHPDGPSINLDRIKIVSLTQREITLLVRHRSYQHLWEKSRNLFL